VLNKIRSRFPFINLLQPEKAAVASVVLMLDPSLASQLDLSSVLPVWREKRTGSRITSNLLGGYGAYLSSSTAVPTVDEVASELIGSNVREIAGIRPAEEIEDQLLREIELARLNPPGPSSASGSWSPSPPTLDAGNLLGVGDWLKDKLRLLDPRERLRLGLKDWTAGDRSFDFQDATDSLYLEMERRIAPSISFVVTGHTHLPRAMTYPSGSHYFNTGTWIRTLQLTQEALADATRFERVWRLLHNSTMSGIDEATIPGAGNTEVKFVVDRTFAAHIRVEDNGEVAGNLLQVTDEGDGVEIKAAEAGKEYRAR
jgi:hypothetical protein